MNLTNTPHEYDFNSVKLFTPGTDQVFIDIGSNRGEAIMSMLLMGKSKPKIIGFEPNKLIFEGLKTKFQNHEKVEIHNVGLGEENNDLVLNVPFYRNWMFDGLASFKLEEAQDWLKTRLWLYDQKKLSIKKVNCQIRKLDDFNLKPYFIKIDVQGFETQVLKGGIETIKAHQPIILVESINEEHMSFLNQFGYKFYGFENDKFIEGKVDGLNTFCINPEKNTDLKDCLN